MGGGADAGSGIHRDPDVPCIPERGATGVQPNPDPDLKLLWPFPLRQGSLDRQRGGQGTRWLLEHRKELVRPGVDFVSAYPTDICPDDRLHVAEEPGVRVIESPYQARRSFDVGEQEGHRPSRQPRNVHGLRLELALSPLLAQLRIEEAERGNPVLLGCSQKALTGPLSRRFVLERSLVEPSQRIPNVRRIVDGEAPAALRVDVRERTVPQAGTRPSVEKCQCLPVSLENGNYRRIRRR